MSKRLFNLVASLRTVGMVIPLLAAKLLFRRETSRASALTARKGSSNTDGSARCAGACSATHTTLVHLVLSAKTAGQAAELKEAFELYESNAVATKQKEQKDGLISEMSLGHVLRSVGQIPTDAQVKEFFVKYSKDGKV